MNDKLINYIFACLKEYVKSGIEENPNKFIYTRSANIMVSKFNMDLRYMDETMFDCIVKEFISFMELENNV